MENKDKIKEQIHNFIDCVIDKADLDGKLDYFHIEISNHNGNLKVKHSLTDIEKVY